MIGQLCYSLRRENTVIFTVYQFGCRTCCNAEGGLYGLLCFQLEVFVDGVYREVFRAG